VHTVSTSPPLALRLRPGRLAQSRPGRAATPPRCRACWPSSH